MQYKVRHQQKNICLPDFAAQGLQERIGMTDQNQIFDAVRPRGRFPLHRFVRHFSVLAVAVTAITPLARVWWVADLIANLRVQLILGLSALVLLALLSRSKKTAAGLLFLGLWQACWLASAWTPAFVGGKKDPVIGTNVPVIRICTANVLTSNRQHDRIIRDLTATDADVLVILELSSSLDQRLRREFHKSYPHVISEPQDDGNFGIGLFSRYPIQDARIFDLTNPTVASVEADVIFGEHPIRIIGTHPVPPISAAYFERRNRQLQKLADRIRTQRLARPEVPILVVGDLNLSPWSPIFRDFLTRSELLDSGAGQGLTPTWYRFPAFPFGLVLDHALVSSDLVCTARRILPGLGSDHRPVLTGFQLAR